MFQKTAGISKKQDQHDTAHEILVDEHSPVDKKPRHQHRQVTDTEIAGSLILFNLPLIQIEKECRNPRPPDQWIAKGCDHTDLPIRQRCIRIQKRPLHPDPFVPLRAVRMIENGRFMVCQHQNLVVPHFFEQMLSWLHRV